MRFWPFEKFEITTSRSPEAIEGCLKEITAQDIYSLNPQTIFWGKIQDKSFKLSKFSRYHNSYRPIIKGIIVDDGAGSIVRVNLQMSLVAIVASLIILAVGLLLTYALVPFIRSGEAPLLSLLILVPVILFGYIIPIVSFNNAAQKTKEFFIEIIGGSAVAIRRS